MFHNVEQLRKVNGIERKNKMYGKELILDIHSANNKKFNRESIDEYFELICKAIKMKKCERFWWDDYGVPDNEKQTSSHTKGTSAVQFILTSSIVIHTLDILSAIYINIFSCKDFDGDLVRKLTIKYFSGEVKQCILLERK